MAALDFPNSPSLNETYLSPDGRSWVWNGTVWNLTFGALAFGATGPTGATGSIGPTGPEADLNPFFLMMGA
jgi:hypothetical protein